METKIYFKGKEIGLGELHKIVCAHLGYVYTVHTSKGKTVQLAHLHTIKLDYSHSTLYTLRKDGVKVNMDIWQEHDVYVGITKIEIDREKGK